MVTVGKEIKLQPCWLGVLDWSKGLPVSYINDNDRAKPKEKKIIDYWGDWVSPCPNEKEIYFNTINNNNNYSQQIDKPIKPVHKNGKIGKLLKILSKNVTTLHINEMENDDIDRYDIGCEYLESTNLNEHSDIDAKEEFYFESDNEYDYEHDHEHEKNEKFSDGEADF